MNRKIGAVVFKKFNLQIRMHCRLVFLQPRYEIKLSMNKFILFLILNFVSNPVFPDPAWLSTDIKISDCKEAQYTQMNCFYSFNEQQLYRIEYYIRNKINNITSETCKKDDVLAAFNERELAWKEYSNSYCGLFIHCVGSCGSGHSSSATACSSSMLGERVKFLEIEIKKGVYIYGCPLRGVSSIKILNTKNYKITLTSKCKLGFFYCDNVIYYGESKKNGSSIKISGKIYMEYNKEKYIDIQMGYEFLNSNIKYTISDLGRLKVEDIKNGNIIVEEVGTWN